MAIAIAIINSEIAPPESAKKSLRVARLVLSPPKVVSIVDSSVNTETLAAARLIALEAEYTGLPNLRYFITFTIAIPSEPKVYAAIAMVVIS